MLSICRSYLQKNKMRDDVEQEDYLSALSESFSIAAPVLLGDFFHNLADGLVIGTAFRSCGGSFAWKMVAVSAAHEIPQEIADLAILITDAKIPWHWATLVNFLSSLSTPVGAAIAYNTRVTANANAYMMSFGAGVYIFVAATELGPRIVHLEHGRVLEALSQSLAFVLGAICIGLILLDHKHCSEAAAEGAQPPGGGGHNHR